MTDWSKVKFRASSWGNLNTEPKEKTAKERGDLSATCQKELIKIYKQVRYDRKTDISTKQMEKGTLCEEESITLYSRYAKKLYVKNEEQLEDEWSCGMPDIFTGEHIRFAEEVDDIKTSWDLDSFLPKVTAKIDDGYDDQLQIYYNLTGAKGGNLVRCLVSAPEEMIMDEMMKLKYKMRIIWDEDPEYLAGCAEIRKNMTFEDIDYTERVIRKFVPRNDERIAMMRNKVPALRAWLSWFEDIHVNGKDADLIKFVPAVLEVPPAPTFTADQVILTKKSSKK